MAHHHEQNGRIYVDTAFLNGTNRIPGVTLKHMGFGEFYAETPKGRVDFDRMRGKDFPGQSGRSHEFRGKGADWLLDQMERAGISVRVASKDTDMNADRSALIRLAALLPKGSPERRAILAGCEKLPEGPMRDNCEKSKKDGVKPGKGKAKSKGKKDDGKMPAELLEKFKAKKKAKRKAPPKEHQFTSEDNPNPKGNDKDGDGKTNEPKPAGLKGKKAGRASGQIMAEITKFADAFLPSLTSRVPAESLGDPKTLKQIQNALVYAMSALAMDVVMEERFGPKGGGQYKRQFGSVLSNPPPFSSQTAHWFEENRDAPKYTAAWKAMSGWAAREGISLDAGARIRAANSKKAALVRLAATLPVGSSERKTILRMAASGV